MAPFSIWYNKPQCDEAEKAYYEKLSGARTGATPAAGASSVTTAAAAPQPGSLAEQIAKARQHIKNSLESVDMVDDKALASKFSSLEVENKELRKVTEDLKGLVISLSERVSKLEGCGSAKVPVAAPEEEEEDDVDLFGSDDEEEDAEKAR